MVGFMPLLVLRLYKDGISVPSMLVWRYGLALVPLAAASALAGHNIRAALRAGAWQITLVGATLGVGQTLCFWESLHTLDTSVAILLFYTYPALTLAVERVVFKRPIPRPAAVCVVVILLGAAIITVPGMSGGLDSRGLAWVLPSPLIYALYLTANSLLMRHYPPLVGAICLYLGLAASFAIAIPVLGLDVPATAGTWLVLLVIAFGPGALSVVLFSYSVPRLGPGSYAIIANCELVTVVVIGVVALGEELTASRVLGGGLIASAILVHGFFGRPDHMARARFDKSAADTQIPPRQTVGWPLSAFGGERKVRAPRRHGAG